ncbi:MAG: hypothetical protein RIR52_1482, partial [Acidobacteriota bacterium]
MARSVVPTIGMAIREGAGGMSGKRWEVITFGDVFIDLV